MVQWKIPKPALADIKVLPAVNKARRPKFELHLKIYDLNNVPLVTGLSQIKWHLPHSIHGDHRGRTTKAPIVNHRVEYHYSRVVPVRIAIDRNNNLSECPIEFEVLQEFDSGGVAGHVEKIVLGKVTLNLAEYVEESEAIVRELRPGTAEGPQSRGHARHRSSLSAHTGGTSRSSLDRDEALSAMDAEEGVVRRYLMQESKVNSTLKIGILMVQIEGERNYIAPALKTAPVFGGIAGIMAGEQVEQDDAGQLPNLSKSRDASEVQDMYRRALAASWACQPGDMPADECIEDIFGGGSGFRDPLYTTAAAATSSPRGAAAPPTMTTTAATGASSSDTASTASSSPRSRGPPHGRSRSNLLARDDSGSDEFEGGGGGGSTLRPRDARLFQQRQQQQQQGLHHSRQHSGGSLHTVTHRPASRSSQQRPPSRSRDETLSVRVPSGGPASSSVTGGGGGRSLRSSESMASLATTLGSDRGREGFKRPSEVGEFEVRDDLVAWRLPGAVS